VYVRAEGLVWWTKGAPVQPLGTTFGGTAPTATSGIPGASGTTVLLGDDHYATHTRGGGRLMAGYWFDDCHLLGIEGGFFVLGRTTTTQNFSSTGAVNLAIPFTNAATGAQQAFPIAGTNVDPFSTAMMPLPNVLDAGSLQLRYTSSLFGYEANLRGVCCQGPCGFIDGLVGFRGLGLDENLNLTATTTGTAFGGGVGTMLTFGDSFAVRNRFYGGQIGTIMESRCGCWVIDLTAKLALGTTQETANISGATSVLGTALLPGFPAPPANGLFAPGTGIGRHTQSVFAVVPEVGVTLGYQWTPRFRTFVGYNFIYWSRVARPGDQINRAVNLTTPATPAFVFRQTDFWAQGLTLGLEWRW
jgi:hypothetical protein